MSNKFEVVFMMFFFLCGTVVSESVEHSSCDQQLFLKFYGKRRSIQVWTFNDAQAIFFRAGMTIDADGAPNAYDPANKYGLDFLGNAGKPGNWWALATDNGKPNGTPLIQQEGQFKGFYISQTSLRDATKSDRDITKYVDASKIPFFVLPPKLTGTEKAHLGDLGMIYNAENNTLCFAIFADVGPSDSIGEGSIALGEALKIPTELRKHNAGQSRNVYYLVFLNTSGNPAWPRTVKDVNEKASVAFHDWGGMERLKLCISAY